MITIARHNYLVNSKISNFLQNNCLETPFLVVDLDVIADKYQRLQQNLPNTQVYYAVKANPAPEILKLLVRLGSNFDTASLFEIEQCLAVGAKPAQISYGNTIKKSRDIAAAYNLGVRLFAFDSLAELEKLAKFAPGSRVYCRLLMECEGAQWPLSKKFGCELEMAHDLLIHSARLGLQPFGVSFHVGSQQRDRQQWHLAIAKVARLFSALKLAGINLEMINLGGGFPVDYNSQAPQAEVYTDAITEALNCYFDRHQPMTMIEPGRWLVADAGLIQSEVVLISKKAYTEDRRWIYLDIGKFGGLAETMDECIKYQICTPKDGYPVAPVVIAGPTCDSADILYDRADYQLPIDLEIGDRVEILGTGAYTTTYASVGFNGFPPLKAYYL